MTDRYAAFVVVLSRDIREDDAEHTINAIRQIKGVASVTPHVAEVDLHIATQRADQEWRTRIRNLLTEVSS